MQTSTLTSTLIGFFKKHFGRNSPAHSTNTNKKETGMEGVGTFGAISETNSSFHPNETKASNEIDAERLAPSPKPKTKDQKKTRKPRKVTATS
jgi:hypothetical protein